MITETPKIELVGFHRDDKPVHDEYPNGTKLTELDTGDEYYYDAQRDRWITNDVALVSIAITTAPTKTTYTEGDKLKLAGMVVKATYDNGDVVVITDYTASPANNTVLATTDTEVTITYTEGGETETATQAITVNGVPAA